MQKDGLRSLLSLKKAPRQQGKSQIVPLPTARKGARWEAPYAIRKESDQLVAMHGLA